VAPGTWRPDPGQFGAFAAAVARRYDGSYPDPLNPGGDLPRVRYWQAWNEPNLDEYLSPQWTRRGGGWVDSSPVVYRGLLNAFFAAVKRVSLSNYVLTGGTAPYGDAPGYLPPGRERMAPVRFYRDLLCVRGRVGLRPVSCPDPPHFDAIDFHVYNVRGPEWPAANPDDVGVPDVHKLTRVVDAGLRTGHVLPRGRKALWVTEISWGSRPPNALGVPLQRHARWYEQAMYLLWRQGVDTIMFLEIRDAIPNAAGPGPDGGLYFGDGRPKPAATAFRFPFVTQRVAPGRVLVWGRSPGAGRLRIERLTGGRWRVVEAVPVRRWQVFLRTVALRGAAMLRGQVGGQSSLSWGQGR
jgi:hypothetical protein